MGDSLLVLSCEDTTLSAAVLGSDGAWLARREAVLPVEAGAGDRLEVDAHDVALISGEVISSVLSSVGAERIGAVSVVSEPGSTVLWEREGSRPFTPIVLGPDRRGEELCRSFRERGWDDAFLHRTGRIPTGRGSGFKLSVLLSETPRALDRAANGELCFGSINSYLIWRLSGSRVHAIDRTEAGTTMLFHLERMMWDTELLEVFTVPPACLPTVFPPASVFTETTLGSRLATAIPLAAAAAELQAVLYGLHCETPGQVHVSLGPLAEIIRISGPEWSEAPEEPSIRMAVAADGSTQYAICHALPICSRLNAWCKALGLPVGADGLAALVRSWSDPSPVRFAGGQIDDLPRTKKAARERVFAGATSETSESTYACALLEAAAHELRTELESVAAGRPPRSISVSGDLARLDALLQRVSDLTGCRVERADTRVSAIVGAARLAAGSIGLSPESLIATAESVYAPALNAAERRKAVTRWNREAAAS